MTSEREDIDNSRISARAISASAEWQAPWRELYEANRERIEIDGIVRKRPGTLPPPESIAHYACRFSGDPNERPAVMIKMENAHIWPGEILIGKEGPNQKYAKEEAARFDAGNFLKMVKCQMAYFREDDFRPVLQEYLSMGKELLRVAPKDKRAELARFITKLRGLSLAGSSPPPAAQGRSREPPPTTTSHSVFLEEEATAHLMARVVPRLRTSYPPGRHIILDPARIYPESPDSLPSGSTSEGGAQGLLPRGSALGDLSYSLARLEDRDYDSNHDELRHYDRVGRTGTTWGHLPGPGRSDGATFVAHIWWAGREREHIPVLRGGEVVGQVRSPSGFVCIAPDSILSARPEIRESGCVSFSTKGDLLVSAPSLGAIEAEDEETGELWVIAPGRPSP